MARVKMPRLDHRTKRLFQFIPIISAILLFLANHTAAQQTTDQYAPESSTNNLSTSENQKLMTAKDFMVVSAHPLASNIGYKILEQGGNAIDAMVAVQIALGLVEPQSSGLGGGAFLLYYDADEKHLTSFDGRETAPTDIPLDVFIGTNKKPMPFFDAVIGGRSVGTPGTVKLLWEAHKRYGKLDWAMLLAPTIKLAKNGFFVTPRLAESVAQDIKFLKSDATSAGYYLRQNKPLKPGSVLKNQDYADVLSILRTKGGDAFYQSPISTSIIEKIQSAKNPGYLSQKDFDNYRVIERKPFCSNYKEYQICGMGPPSSGATTVAQILGIIEPYNLSKEDYYNPITWQVIADASRLAFADRGLYIADPDFISLPDFLFNADYLNQRSKVITPGLALPNVQAGSAPVTQAKKLSSGFTADLPSTTHFSIVDKSGNIVSMTSTIENRFGSRLMVQGFMLNNELTDFSFARIKDDRLIANRVEPGKRPRSSMAPTIVFKAERPFLVLGSPGGSRIINYVANTLIRMLDFDIPLLEAINAPHQLNRFGVMELEANAFPKSYINQFETMGYTVAEKDLNSGIHAIQINGKTLIGAADRRREGVVRGK